MLENNLIKYLGRKENVLTEMKHLDNLEYKTFVNKFNNAYDRTLRTEQKDLLTNYIVSFSDNGLGLKTFLNEDRLSSSSVEPSTTKTLFEIPI